MSDGGPQRPCEEEHRARGRRRVAGVDEAGRGPLAGPVVAAAVILPPDHGIEGLRDSKLLSPSRREKLDLLIRRAATAVSVALVSERGIDKMNILRATHLAMARAVAGLDQEPDFLLVDGLPVPGLPVPHQAIIGGDRLCASIAAASIVAKVFRDAIMVEYHLLYPVYNFSRNKGYGTRDHLRAIAEHGPCPIHRRTFRGVKEHLRGAGDGA